MAHHGPTVLFFAVSDEGALRAFALDSQTVRELNHHSVLEADNWQHARVLSQNICVSSQKVVVLYWQKPWLNKIASFRSMFEPRTSLHIPYTIQVDSKGTMFHTSHTPKADDNGNLVYDEKGMRIMLPSPGIQGTLTMDESQHKVGLPSSYIMNKEKRGHSRVMETEYGTSYNLLTTSEESSGKRSRRKPRKK